MGVLYYRDGADKMKKPSIDRIDNNGDYTYENCRFIEMAENSRKAHKGKIVSESTRNKMRISALGNKNGIGNKGRSKYR